MSGTLTARRLAGIVAFTIDGDSWDVVGDCEYSPSVVARETLKGQSRVEGYSEMPQQGFISARLRDRGDEAVQNLNLITNSTVVVQAANGKTIYGAGMWQIGEIGVNTQEGTLQVRFESDSVVESAA